MTTGSDDNEEREGAKRVKVTDRRMFTPDGELREEYKDLGAASDGEERPPGEGGAAGAAGTPRPEPTAGAAAGPAPGPGASPGAGPGPGPGGPGGGGAPPLEIPDTGAGPAPSFYDLVGILAEPASIYLQQAQQGGEDRAQNLEIARLHVELLDVLRKKTLGNLSAQESAALEDVLYQLRMGYVQVRG